MATNRRRARVVLRVGGGKRQQLDVSDYSEGACESTSEPETLHLTPATHYDHSAWLPPPAPPVVSTNQDSITRDVFREKLRLNSSHPLHSTPTRGRAHSLTAATIRHPMQPLSVSSTVFRGHTCTCSSASSSDLESDEVFVDRPATLPQAAVVHPEGAFDGRNSKTLPPLRGSSRPLTSPGKSSTDSSVFISPIHSKVPPRPRKRPGKNRVHPNPDTASAAASSAVSTEKEFRTNSVPLLDRRAIFRNLASTRNDSLFSTTRGSLDSTSTTSSSLAPLLTSSLRKGGARPSGATTWEFDGEAQLEGCFPDRHIRVYTATWNMQEQKELPESLDDLLLPLAHDVAADMYVIGTQESTPSRREWEVLIQQTLGPAFVLVHSASLGVLYLLLYIRRDLIWHCSAVRSAGYATRPITLIKTKGGLGLCFSLFGSSFLFVSSHFTAHQQKVSERNSDMQRTAANLLLSDVIACDKVSDGFDRVFWMGDLNYRVQLEREQADEHIASSDWMALLLKDQLTREILEGHVFEGFSEQPITFPPSYKFDRLSDVYDSSEKRRIPSWTDRILFKSNSGSPTTSADIVGLGYDCCSTIRASDHRPVYALFRVRLKPCENVDGVPDSVVTFDRVVFMKAQQQRGVVARLSVSAQGGGDFPDGPSMQHRRPSGRNVATSSMCAIL